MMLRARQSLFKTAFPSQKPTLSKQYRHRRFPHHLPMRFRQAKGTMTSSEKATFAIPSE